MNKLLFLTDGIPPFAIGGMQKHSFLVVEHLAKLGVQIELHHIATKQQLEELQIPFSTEALKNIELVAHHFPKSNHFPGHYLYNSYRLSKQMYFAVKNNINSFDFIYTKGFMGWYLLEQKTNIQPKIGVKFHGMNMFLTTKGLKETLAQYMLRPPVKSIMQKADLVFSYGGKVSETIQSVGISQNKIIEIPTGITRDWLSDKANAPSSPLRFVFVGRYDTVKGILPLQEAIKMSTYHFEFHFVGPFEKDKQLNDARVRYHGSVNDTNEMQSLLDTMDVLVLPSYSEGMPNVILEAMARGLAILATDVGAVGMLVNHENGILLPKSTPQLIQNAMEQLIKSDDLNSKKAMSRKKVANFTWDKIAHKLTEAIQQSIYTMTKKKCC